MRGRQFAEEETQDRPCVAIVSQAMASRFWPGSDPIGKRIKPGSASSPGDWFMVVGMVRDVQREI